MTFSDKSNIKSWILALFIVIGMSNPTWAQSSFSGAFISLDRNTTHDFDESGDYRGAFSNDRGKFKVEGVFQYGEEMCWQKNNDGTKGATGNVVLYYDENTCCLSFTKISDKYAVEVIWAKPYGIQTDVCKNSVFKRILDADGSTKAPEKKSTKDISDKVGKSTYHDRVTAKMTEDESAALRQQISGCWSVRAGTRYAENLVVDVKLYMNPDRTIISKMVLDQYRYASDSYFRAAADTALRALEDPNCTPLNLPPTKYDQWKVITVRFDPKEMLD